jgi:flagellar protein FliL
MPIEERVMAQPKIGAKIGGGGGIKIESSDVEVKVPGGGGKKKLIIIIAAAIVLLGGAAAAYFLFLAPSGSSEAKPKPTPTQVAGVIETFEPHSLNLADGHYLRLGIALQLTEEAGEEPGLDPADALDAAILVFSGKTVAEVQDPTTREELRAQLLEACQEAYGEEIVMGVKYTDYVTQ